MSKINVYDEITKASKSREDMIKDLRAELLKAEADKANADQEAAEAINSGDVDAYTKAKNASRSAADRIEFYIVQIRSANRAPLFDDYIDKIAEIKADQQAQINQINEKATKAMHEINNIIADFYKSLEASNKALELVYMNTGFTYRPTTALPIGTIYKSTEAAKVNPELSKYW